MTSTIFSQRFPAATRMQFGESNQVLVRKLNFLKGRKHTAQTSALIPRASSCARNRKQGRLGFQLPRTGLLDR